LYNFAQIEPEKEEMLRAVLKETFEELTSSNANTNIIVTG